MEPSGRISRSGWNFFRNAFVVRRYPAVQDASPSLRDKDGLRLIRLFDPQDSRVPETKRAHLISVWPDLRGPGSFQEAWMKRLWAEWPTGGRDPSG